MSVSLSSQTLELVTLLLTLSTPFKNTLVWAFQSLFTSNSMVMNKYKISRWVMPIINMKILEVWTSLATMLLQFSCWFSMHPGAFQSAVLHHEFSILLHRATFSSFKWPFHLESPFNNHPTTVYNLKTDFFWYSDISIYWPIQVCLFFVLFFQEKGVMFRNYSDISIYWPIQVWFFFVFFVFLRKRSYVSELS